MKKLSVILLLSIIISLLCGCSSDNSKTAEKDTKATTSATETTTEITTNSTTTEKETQGTEKDENNDICAPLSDEKYGAEYEKVWESEDGVIRFLLNCDKGPKGYGIYEGTYNYEAERTDVTVYVLSYSDGRGPEDEGHIDVYKEIYEDGFPDDPDADYLGDHVFLSGDYKIADDNKSFTVTVSDMEENLKYKRPKDSIESKYKNGDKVVFHQVSE
ncbi:MAG: hypothetical protein ACI4RL_03705 [Ruminococcus sp.]